MQSILSTLCLKLGGFSLPVKAKPNSLDWSTKPWSSCPCCPPSMPCTPHTLYLLCAHLTDLWTLLTQQVLSHFPAYNTFLHIYWFLHTPQGFWCFHGKNFPNLPPLSLPQQCTRWQIIIQPPQINSAEFKKSLPKFKIWGFIVTVLNRSFPHLHNEWMKSMTHFTSPLSQDLCIFLKGRTLYFS